MLFWFSMRLSLATFEHSLFSFSPFFPYSNPLGETASLRFLSVSPLIFCFPRVSTSVSFDELRISSTGLYICWGERVCVVCEVCREMSEECVESPLGALITD